MLFAASRRKLFLVLVICLLVAVFAVWRFSNSDIESQLNSKSEEGCELVERGQYDEALSLYENLLVEYPEAEYPQVVHFRGEIATCCTYALNAIDPTGDSNPAEEYSRWFEILAREGNKILQIGTESRIPEIETAAVVWILSIRWNMDKWRETVDGITAQEKSVAKNKVYETLKEQLSEIDRISQRFAQLQWAVEAAGELESLGNAQIQQVKDKIQGSKEN